jgi:16S rRNA (guanine(1405)-N(7))-methyltransferase
MCNDSNFADIVQNIIHSKKYKSLYEKTIEHNVQRCLDKYGKKQAEKKARNLLHQIWSAYYDHQPDFSRLYESFVHDVSEYHSHSFQCHSRENGNPEKFIKNRLRKLLSVQSSTRERIGILDNFYKRIFAITGFPSSIIDHACGLNPLAYLWMNLPDDVKYQAFDIEGELISFLNSIFQFLGLKNMEARLGDVLVDEFNYADVVFMLKFLPVLEQQEKGSSLQVMRKQKCRRLVVSFPVKSLSGKEKGMKNFYSDWFKKTIESENWKYEEIPFDTELVFIINLESISRSD